MLLLISMPVTWWAPNSQRRQHISAAADADDRGVAMGAGVVREVADVVLRNEWSPLPIAAVPAVESMSDAHLTDLLQAASSG